MNFFSARSLEALLKRRFAQVVVGYYARSFAFRNTPPLYAHLFAVAAHSADGLWPAGGRSRGWRTILADGGVRRLLSSP